jgi:hypothetical protein
VSGFVPQPGVRFWRIRTDEPTRTAYYGCEAAALAYDTLASLQHDEPGFEHSLESVVVEGDAACLFHVPAYWCVRKGRTR